MPAFCLCLNRGLLHGTMVSQSQSMVDCMSFYMMHMHHKQFGICSLDLVEPCSGFLVSVIHLMQICFPKFGCCNCIWSFVNACYNEGCIVQKLFMLDLLAFEAGDDARTDKICSVIVMSLHACCFLICLLIRHLQGPASRVYILQVACCMSYVMLCIAVQFVMCVPWNVPAWSHVVPCGPMQH